MTKGESIQTIRGDLSTAAAQLATLLDDVQRGVEQGEEADVLLRLCQQLNHWQQTLPEQEWKQLGDTLRQHPLHVLLLQDPFTARAFAKPRGYAGDAVVMDLIYAYDGAVPHPVPDVTPLGARIYQQVASYAAGVATRNRRALLAAKLDEIADACAQPHVFAVACGHLREAAASQAVVTGRIGRFLALDQDPVSLAEVTATVGRYGVETVEESVTALLRGKIAYDNLDFVYSAGLYDYLSDKVAQRLTRLLFDMLKPGGRLLLANFSREHASIGYMEAFMDWFLVYRDEQQVRDFLAEIPAEQIASCDLYRTEEECIIYLEVQKSS